MQCLGLVTLDPGILNVFEYGIVGRAMRRGLVRIMAWNPRDFASGGYRRIDDRSYGGGPGMVMMFEPLVGAIQHAKQQLSAVCQNTDAIRTIYLSPQGRLIHQCDIASVAKARTPIIFVAGRYEGIDERVINECIDEEWSLGDFVLSNGEFAAMAFIDAIVRLLPGSLGNAASATQDSFVDGLLDYPHYTQPAVAHGLEVPKILLSGDHRAIARWRRQQSLGKTMAKRPDLLKNIKLSELDQRLLDEFEF